MINIYNQIDGLFVNGMINGLMAILFASVIIFGINKLCNRFICKKWPENHNTQMRMLMVNNVGFGVGARITGLSIVKTTACTFVCSLILLAGGAAVGRRFGGGHLGRYAGVCSAALIVALGVYELFI